MKKSIKYKLAKITMYTIGILIIGSFAILVLYSMIKLAFSDIRMLVALIVFTLIGITIYCHNYIRTIKYSAGDRVQMKISKNGATVGDKGVIKAEVPRENYYIVTMDNSSELLLHNSEIRPI